MANITIAVGLCSQEGFLIRMLGTSKTKKGNVKNVSIFNFNFIINVKFVFLVSKRHHQSEIKYTLYIES